MNQKQEKPLRWIASALNDLKKFPEDVQDVMGYALDLAQHGQKHPDAKPLYGFSGAGVLEIVDDFDGDTYRAIYTVKFEGVIYLLHSFQKKSKHGIATPQQDIELVKKRLKIAQDDYLQLTAKKMDEENKVDVSSGNVFADLGLSNPEERLLKAELVRKISEIITNLNLTQVQVAEILGIDQPKVSLLIRGRLSGFSTDRLIAYLNKLGSDVEITVKPKPENRKFAQTIVF